MKLLFHPSVAFRDCKHCLEWQYDETNGEVVRSPARTGPLLRRIGKAPCQIPSVGCAKGSPTAGREISDKNWKAYLHYKECEATGIFPNDEIVRRNASIIKSVIESEERSERNAWLRMIAMK